MPVWLVDATLGLAGWRVAVVDAAGDEVLPMRADGARDRAGRRLPAHLDPCIVPASRFPDGWRDRRDRPSPEFGFSRRLFRDIERAVDGTPDDHPEHVAAAQARRRNPRRGWLRALPPPSSDGDECDTSSLARPGHHR
ncbi:MAG: hypothetical protein DLM56_11845 [Pseudonocardiales bacterium]|nr:MAG: hypothetical protein DLM56_11845 [Pseudonocardiales bacterium]